MKKLISKMFLGSIVYKVVIDSPFNEVLTALENSIKKNSFSIPAIHNLKKTFEKSELKLDNDFEYQIVQICNAKKSHKVLTTMSYDMGIMMPKSIIVARENGKTVLRFMKMKPWMISLMFPDINIVPMSKNVMATMKKIVDETVVALS